MEQFKQQTPERHVVNLFAKRWENHDTYVLRCTLLAMLNGVSLSTDTIRNNFSVPEARVTRAYSTDRYDLDSSGQVIDVFGVSTTEKQPFSVTHDSVSLSVCCALVSMMLGLLAGQRTTIRSCDPTSGTEIVVDLSESITNVSPKSSVAVLVCPTEQEFCRDQWNSFCKYVRMYERKSNVPEDLNHATLLTIEQLHDLARELLQNLSDLERK